MTGKTFAEKALARAARVSDARAGDILDISPDMMLSHDNSAAIRRIFEEIGAPRIVYSSGWRSRSIKPSRADDQTCAEPRQIHDGAQARALLQERGITTRSSAKSFVLPGERSARQPPRIWLARRVRGRDRADRDGGCGRRANCGRVPEAMRITRRGNCPPGSRPKT
jgi:3-isopropylmalate/(R)-2-methylmalate dehydratase large subunit